MGDINSKFNKRIVTVVACCTNFLPLTRRNKRYADKLQSIFGSHELAVPLYRTLFRPSFSNIINKVPRAAGSRYIAVHIRQFNTNQDQLIESMAFCLKHISNLPENKGVPLYIAAVSQALINGIKK